MNTGTTTDTTITVLCPDWGVGHGRRVLRQGPSAAAVSHGMCDDCQRFVLADAVRALEYRQYLASPVDPRD